MLIYATPLELAQWDNGPDATVEQAPANAVALLRSASVLIRSKTRNARYLADRDGYARDVPTRAAFKDAACSLASTWAKLKIDPSNGGVAALKPAVQSKSIGSTSFTYVQNDGTEASRQALASGQVLTFEAYEILRQGKLITATVGQGVPVGVYVVDSTPIDLLSGRAITGGEY